MELPSDLPVTPGTLEGVYFFQYKCSILLFENLFCRVSQFPGYWISVPVCSFFGRDERYLPVDVLHAWNKFFSAHCDVATNHCTNSHECDIFAVASCFFQTKAAGWSTVIAMGKCRLCFFPVFIYAGKHSSSVTIWAGGSEFNSNIPNSKRWHTQTHFADLCKAELRISIRNALSIRSLSWEVQMRHLQIRPMESHYQFLAKIRKVPPKTVKCFQRRWLFGFFVVFYYYFWPVFFLMCSCL